MTSRGRQGQGARPGGPRRLGRARPGGLVAVPRGSDDPGGERRREVAELSHDLRQPAACIRALVASGLASLAQGESPERQLRSIDAEVQQMMSMLAAALDDLPSGGSGTETASIAEALNDAFAYVRLVHGTTVVAAPSAQRALGVPVSSTQLRRALGNVLDNAARAAGADGRVVVSVRRHRGAVYLRVDDDGPGFGAVPSEHLVGLRSAEQQLRQLGGRLEIVPSGPLGGARVVLVVPDARPAAPTRSEQERSRANPGL